MQELQSIQCSLFADENRLGTGLCKRADIWWENEFTVLSKFATILKKKTTVQVCSESLYQEIFIIFFDFGGNSLIHQRMCAPAINKFQCLQKWTINTKLLFFSDCTIDMEKRRKDKKKRALDPRYGPKMGLPIAFFLCTGRSDIFRCFVLWTVAPRRDWQTCFGACLGKNSGFI